LRVLKGQDIIQKTEVPMKKYIALIVVVLTLVTQLAFGQALTPATTGQKTYKVQATWDGPATFTDTVSFTGSATFSAPWAQTVSTYTTFTEGVAHQKNVAASAGVTFDGVDISAHVASTPALTLGVHGIQSTAINWAVGATNTVYLNASLTVTSLVFPTPLASFTGITSAAFWVERGPGSCTIHMMGGGATTVAASMGLLLIP